MRSILTGIALLALACLPLAASAQATLPALTATPGPNGGETYSLSVQTLLMLTSLTFIPAALLMMTGFTRIIIVLSLMRNALGTQTTPPNLVLVGLALFLTAYTMSPVFDQIYKDAYQPLSNGTIS
ncbi:MAG TPA: flagellar biosynthetic protein FliP, partial [Bordetella sp.]|nr:flagellar biosynthetic protein FliP [Bordetella sp.]